VVVVVTNDDVHTKYQRALPVPVLAISVFWFLPSAVSFLHTQSPAIAHRDLKLENVLLTHSGHYKLIDFGSAVEGEDREFSRGR